MEDVELFRQFLKETGWAPHNDMGYKDPRQLFQQWKTQSQLGETSDKMGALSDKLLDPNSSYYKQYQSYLQKTMPGIGVNTLLAPLMAGGTGYAGGMDIANKKMQAMVGQRQDKINTGVQGFALGNLNVGANLLGQKGSLQLGIGNMQLDAAQLAEQKRQYDESNSGWGAFTKMLGSGLGMYLSGGFGGGGAGSGVGGYYGDTNNSGR